MARNPYSPPEAPVESRAPGPQRPRPKQVEWASWCLWGSIAIGFSALFFSDELKNALGDISADLRSLARGFLVVFLALFTALYLWLIQRMRAGRNWARVVLLVLTLMSLLGDLSPGIWSEPAILIASSVVDVALQIAAIVLMFGRPGSEWFRKPPD